MKRILASTLACVCFQLYAQADISSRVSATLGACSDSSGSSNDGPLFSDDSELLRSSDFDPRLQTHSVEATTNISRSFGGFVNNSLKTTAETFEIEADVSVQPRACDSPYEFRTLTTLQFRYSGNIDTNIVIDADEKVFPVGSEVTVPFSIFLDQSTQAVARNATTEIIIRDLNVNTLKTEEIQANALGGRVQKDSNFVFVNDGTPYVVNVIFSGQNNLSQTYPQNTEVRQTTRNFSDKHSFKFGTLPAGITCEGIEFEIEGCNTSAITVYYINGIRTDEVGVALDFYTFRNATARRFGGELPDGLKVQYLYNPTGGNVADIVESVDQRLTELEISFAETVGEILLNFAAQPTQIKDAVRQVVLSAIQENSSSPIVNRQLEAYRADLQSPSTSIIIVSHSQGNFYANLGYESLSSSERERVQVIAVATPTSSVAGNGDYTTDLNDFIQLIPSSLLYNVINTTNPFELYYLDVLGHSFRKYYLAAGFESEAKILDDLESAILVLKAG